MLTHIELLITSYFNIVKRTMIDMVPKAVMYTLVQYVVSLFPRATANICADFPKTRCSVSSWRTCTATRNSTNY